MEMTEDEIDYVFFKAGERVGEQARCELGEAVALRDCFMKLMVSSLGRKSPYKGFSLAHSRRLVLIAHFVQGAPCTGELILEGFYSKAAAALKQDIELLVRLEEEKKQVAREGKVPHMSHAPLNAKKLYGLLNALAHPCNEELLNRHITAVGPGGERAITFLPVFNVDTVRMFYSFHCWLAYMFCCESVETVGQMFGQSDGQFQADWTEFLRLEQIGITQSAFGLE